MVVDRGRPNMTTRDVATGIRCLLGLGGNGSGHVDMVGLESGSSYTRNIGVGVGKLVVGCVVASCERTGWVNVLMEGGVEVELCGSWSTLKRLK